MKYISLEKIKLFFNNDKFNGKQIKLDECTYILDINNFTKRHINYLENNPKNKRFLPYYNRLLKLYIILQK